MAYGEHWEWRGFGGISPRFAKAYLLLPGFYDTHTVVDRYVWIPGLDVNAKFRKGEESGFKFKRLKQQQGNFEVWLEDEDELYEFPLEPEAWGALGQMLQDVDIELPSYPATPPDREDTARILEDVGCKIISVTKERETRKLENTDGTVLVEWASIKSPQPCTSIGLETYSDESDVDLSNEQSLHLIKEALDYLDIQNQPLLPMNYLDAVKQWARENKI
ncbi:hypothetical protein NC796_15740 [Aliifodinibius sp. S!AR15-10]|uniref:hypothetical protein n=1 Tax=Aliifodinibius sp. S!AR15-10 TaxID=2950437 RepID=UPI002855F272|nr:hypothetical protein [Aliifodinibius sp. S!AR15-10]MDR8392608.1 hypothetical protein [Aliifodinibius sp. S!AR15-10]